MPGPRERKSLPRQQWLTPETQLTRVRSEMPNHRTHRIPSGEVTRPADTAGVSSGATNAAERTPLAHREAFVLLVLLRMGSNWRAANRAPSL